MLLSLPDESLLAVLRFLHYKDLCRVSCVNHRFHRLYKDGSLWYWQCEHYFLNTRCDKVETWYEHFVSLYKDYGRYRNYREIRGAWNKIEAFLEKNCPNILASLQDGVSEEELQAVEENIQSKLPDDLRLSYRIHNGQNKFARTGVLGGCQFPGTYESSSSRMITLKEMEYKFDNTGVLAGCVFLSEDRRSHARLIMSLSDEFGFNRGTIYSFITTDYFFVMGTTFLEWFCDYANKLEQNAFYVTDEFIYKFYHEPGCVDGNIGITVKPATCFIPQLSHPEPPTNFFAYRIMIEMSEDTPSHLSCQLKSRYWRIKDGDGREEEVYGPGVVGEYPVMKPGAKFAWISCTTFESTYGEMKGHFVFTNLRTGDETIVPCPLFCMKAPPCLTAEERWEIEKARLNENG